MSTAFLRFVGGLALAGALALAGCGGGGGGGGDAPSDATLSGVAATGAPFSGATINVYDRAGTLLATTTAAADGTYSVTIPLTAQAPLVVEATRDDQTLVSTFAETRSTRLNITPLTNLIAARLAPDGNPLNLRGHTEGVTPAGLQAKVAEIVAILKPLLDVIGDSADPLTGNFTADGSGHDKVLDSLQVDIRLTATSSNIEITVRAASAEPIRTSFTSTDASPAPLPSAQITADALPPDNVAGMIAALIARQNACYALPAAQRVSASTGDGTAVTAAECRTLFLNDDPTTYLSNGARVGSSGAFSTLFRSGADGLFSDAAQLEFIRTNADKDLVFSFRWKDSGGNIGYEQQVARNVGGTLKLVGNQYVYNARVRPFQQDREFLNQAAADSQSTGYNVAIDNRLDGSSNPVFTKVLVTTPDGSVLTYKPSGARSQLVIQRSDGTLTNSPVVRLAGRFKNGSTGAPAEPSLYMVSPMYSDEQLRAIPEQGVWRLEFFHADTTKANVVQSYRTVSRAPTLAELAAASFASVVEASKEELRSETASTGVITFGPPSMTTPNIVDMSSAGDNDFWTVPAGAVAPSFITVYGRGPDPDGSGPATRVPYDDGVGVRASARKVIIACSPLGSSDNHCDDSTGVLQYAEGTVLSSIELWGVNPRMVEVSKVVNTYSITLP